jgi:type IX secretion system PorP/SprF family membrane protein
VDRAKSFLGDDVPDPLINKGVLYVPDANFGIHYLATDYYGGFSISQLFSSSLQFGAFGDGEYEMIRHMNINGGYKFKINYDLTFEPSVLLKVPMWYKPQLDINAKFIYREDYWGGLSFRTGSSLIFFGGIKFEKFYFGYSFDYIMSTIRKYTYGSHEIMMAAKFGDNARRYRWLNRY